MGWGANASANTTHRGVDHHGRARNGQPAVRPMAAGLPATRSWRWSETATFCTASCVWTSQWSGPSPPGLAVGAAEHLEPRLLASGARLRVCPAPDRPRSPQSPGRRTYPSLPLHQGERPPEIKVAQTCICLCRFAERREVLFVAHGRAARAQIYPWHALGGPRPPYRCNGSRAAPCPAYPHLTRHH
jgi:hypothetical protein